MKAIVQKDDPVLRQKAELVPIESIKTQEIAEIITSMSQSLATQDDGVALAAPQIGISKQIFIVSDDLLSRADESYEKTGKDLVFINPRIIKMSRTKKLIEEGCLSVRWYYGMIRRANKVTLEYYNENGEKIIRGASGLLAQIFQHETDHLNGLLFIDHAEEVWEMDEEEVKKHNK